MLSSCCPWQHACLARSIGHRANFLSAKYAFVRMVHEWPRLAARVLVLAMLGCCKFCLICVWSDIQQCHATSRN